MRPKIPGVILAGLLLAGMTGACTDVGAGPDVPMSIEMAAFPSPSVVVGDTLRNEAGVVAPVRAIVRNGRGDEIADAKPLYLYADFNRDSALIVDSARGVIVARKAPTGDPRIAARIGASLQVLRPILVTQAPDSVSGSAPSALTLSLPDTARKNTTGEFSVTVRHTDGIASNVAGWLVRYEVLHPANPANDTTGAAYLVNDNRAASVIDTTDSGGRASRSVRVRPQHFPTSGAQNVSDSVVVQVTVRYRGQLVDGTPLRLTVPVKR